jgi:hypothetical protein
MAIATLATGKPPGSSSGVANQLNPAHFRWLGEEVAVLVVVPAL